MLAALLLSALAVGPAPAVTPPNDPSIELWISNDRRFMPGEDVQVQVRTQEDGYLLVLHADPDGRVHVLFPIDPDDDNFVHGGKRYEIRGRADRKAFEASITGHGTVYAAISHDPFDFDRYNSAGHWDYRALAPDRLSGDPEAALTELVRGMARSNFDYDVLGYDVIERVYAPNYRPYRHWATDPFCDPVYYDYFCRPDYGYGSYLSVSLTFGRPYRGYYYGHDPFFYDPYYYYYRPYAYAYPYPYRYYSTYWYAPRRPHNGPSRLHGDFVFGNYRDRRNAVGRVNDGYHWPLVRARDGGVPSRRVDGAATAPAARPAIDRRPADGRAVDARPADRGAGRRPDGRTPVEGHRARPRDDRDAQPRARPNIESRPAERPQGRRAERSGDDSPREERRPQPESRPRDDQPRAEPRAEPRRRDSDDGDREAAPERRGGGNGDSRPADRGGRGGGGGGGGGRRR